MIIQGEGLILKTATATKFLLAESGESREFAEGGGARSKQLIASGVVGIFSNVAVWR